MIIGLFLTTAVLLIAPTIHAGMVSLLLIVVDCSFFEVFVMKNSRVVLCVEEKSIALEFLMDVCDSQVEFGVMVFGVKGKCSGWIEDSFEFGEEYGSVGDEMEDIIE